jgi:hypothetical protein
MQKGRYLFMLLLSSSLFSSLLVVGLSIALLS